MTPTHKPHILEPGQRLKIETCTHVLLDQISPKTNPLERMLVYTCEKLGIELSSDTGTRLLTWLEALFLAICMDDSPSLVAQQVNGL